MELVFAGILLLMFVVAPLGAWHEKSSAQDKQPVSSTMQSSSSGRSPIPMTPGGESRASSVVDLEPDGAGDSELVVRFMRGAFYSVPKQRPPREKTRRLGSGVFVDESLFTQMENDQDE